MQNLKRRFYLKKIIKIFFPQLDDVVLTNDFNAKNADEYIRKSYKGGWCYLKNEKANKKFKKGVTLDVNSLYPFCMHSSSGNYFPIGKPEFFKDKIPDFLLNDNVNYSNYYYFVSFKCRFKIKKGMLPTLQIKGNIFYEGNKWLETSDIEHDGKFYRYMKGEDGKLYDTDVTLTMTCVDFELFKKHYELFDFKLLDGCYFRSEKGIFDSYINKYMSIKEKEKGAKRTQAKLFLNNLYGKLATSSKSTYKYCFLDSEKVLRFINVYDESKKTLHIACGSAITSYARNYTINHAQANYDTFIYSDTDSIHLSTQDDIKMCNIDDKKLGMWKKEKIWDIAIFVRQKTYVESQRVKKELKVVNRKREVKKVLEFGINEIDVKCAGMTQACKDYFISELRQKKKTLADFKVGYSNNEKLRVKRIRGGIVLVNSTFNIR